MILRLRRHELDLPPFYLLSDVDFIRERAKALGVQIKLADVDVEDALTSFADALPVVDAGHVATAGAGCPDNNSAPAAIASIRRAVSDVSAGRAAAGSASRPPDSWRNPP